MKRQRTFIAIALTSALLAPISNSPVGAAANPKAGATCSKAGKTAVFKGKKFTCIKKGKKLTWNKGIAIPKAVTTPSPKATTALTPSPSSSSSPSQSPSSSPSPSLSSSPLASPSPSASPSLSSTPTTSATASPSPTPSTSASEPPAAPPSPSPSATPKTEPATPTHAGTVEDPELFNTFLAKNGIKVKVLKVTDKVSELVCKTELIQDGCDFGGAVDADSESRFVEIVITVVNNGSETWIPAIFGLFRDDEYYGGDFIVDGDIPGVIELEVGETITLNTYIAISKEVVLKDCLFFISESSAEEAFYLKVD